MYTCLSIINLSEFITQLEISLLFSTNNEHVQTGIMQDSGFTTHWESSWQLRVWIQTTHELRLIGTTIRLIVEEASIYWLAQESCVIFSLPCFTACTAREPRTSKSTAREKQRTCCKEQDSKRDRQKRVSPFEIVKNDNSRVMSKQCLMLARIKRDRGGILCMQDEKNELAIDWTRVQGELP